MIKATPLSELIEQQTREKETKLAQKTEDNQKLETADNTVDSFYKQGSTSLEKLILIRSKWDKYIVESGKGSRVPQYLIDPPTPSNQQWAQYLKPKNT